MLTIKAPAKINWFLMVTGKRPDGFHDIMSLMQCVSLFDTLSFEQSANITIETSSGIPMEDNLVYKAALLIKDYSGSSAGARIRLDKKIPIAAGLGGGSSDAASTLLGLNDLWGLGLGLDALSGLAAQLGSDVPFFIYGGPAMASGRGEVLEPLLNGPSCVIALVKPKAGVSAGFAYSGIKGYSKSTPSAGEVRQAIQSAGLSEMSVLMVNDLEPPVFEAHPEVHRIKESFLTHGAASSLMSGSGSTVFGAFRSEDEAVRAVDSVKSDIGPGLWSAVVRTI